MGLRVIPEFKGDNRLMFITHKTPKYDEVDQVRMAIEGGCSWIQLRMKDHFDQDIAKRCKVLCEKAHRKVVLCVDDRLPEALDIKADACHLGKKDMPLNEAWDMVNMRICDRNELFFIGSTANTIMDIRLSYSLGASYIGLGPYRYTTTKSNLSPILGLEGYREIVSSCRAEGIDIPIFAIGGITLDDVAPLMESGVTGLAVSGAIINAEDPVAETRRFIEEINKY